MVTEAFCAGQPKEKLLLPVVNKTTKLNLGMLKENHLRKSDLLH